MFIELGKCFTKHLELFPGIVWSTNPGFWLQEPELTLAPSPTQEQLWLFPLSIRFGLSPAVVTFEELFYHQEPNSLSGKWWGGRGQ